MTKIILIAGKSLDKLNFTHLSRLQHNTIITQDNQLKIKTNFGKQLFQYIGSRLWKEVPCKLKTHH